MAPPEVPPSSPLVERDGALSALQASLQQCRAGGGRTVLVHGEAGIGKTSLLRSWAREAQEQGGASVYWGGCEALFTPRPLGPVLDIAHALGPSVALLVQNQPSPSDVFAAIGAWLRVPAVALSARQALPRVNVLVFEDVHWADHLTLDFLKYLGRRIHAWPALLVMSYRDDEAGVQHPLMQVVGDLPRATTDRIALAPLSLAALTTLARATQASVSDERIAQLLAATGGNPFFATEVLATARDAVSHVPSTVAVAVMARAQRVGPAARAVLDVASLVPGSIEPALVSALVGAGAAQGIEECVNAGLLQWALRGLAFRHELARRAVEAALSPMRRRETHALLYSQLRQQSDDLLDRTAYHAQHAHDSQAVLATAPLAALHAAAMGAHREAAAHYRAALDHAQHADEAQRADLLERWASECSLTAAVGDDVVAARLQALALRRKLGQTEKVGLNQRHLSSLYRTLGRLDEAQRWLDDAIATLESIEPSPGLAMAYSMRSAGYMLTNRWQLAQTWGERAIALAQRFEEHGTIAHALNNIGSALADDGQMRGFELLQQSLEIALAHNLHDHASRAYRNASEASVRNRLLAQAEALLEPGIAFARAHDMDLHVFGLVGALVQVRLMQGRLDEARALAVESLRAEPALVAPSAMHITVVTVAETIAMIQSPSADSSTLEAHWSDALVSCEPDRVVPLALGLAEGAWLRGDHERCAAITRAALNVCAELTLWDRGELACWLQRAGHDAHDLTAHAIAAPCAHELGGDLEAAAAGWQERGMPRHQAYALMLMDPRQHPEALAQALALFDRMGARACAEHARRRARKLASDGVKGIKTGPRAAARANRFGLTPRELQIAEQLAQGRSNQDIAKALSRSERTVENHVATVLAKLGAKRRGDVAALLATRDT
jgi:DNA-binding CsgD family transcriptional regulator/tetratricopeptide (TPR) repeat protein